MKSKVLLFSYYNFDDYSGGPSGFIKQNILGKNIEGLITLQTLQQEFKPGLLKKVRKVLDQGFNKKESNFWLINRINSAVETYQYYNCNKFNFIYFHDIFSLFGCLKHIPKSQKIILQSHAPELVSEEFKSLPGNEALIEQIIQIEQTAFEKANYLVFPNQDAAIIYKSLIHKNSKVHNLTSASRLITKPHIIPLENHNINLLFIGRKNRIKGYDVLMNTFKKLREIRKDFNLFLAGDDESTYQEGVVPLGKVNPDNWIASVDYVINVNENSYFDLSVMEVLGVGTPLILTLTGGHTFFKDKSEGIITLGSLDFNSLYILLLNIKKPSLIDKAKMVEANQNLYKNYFTTELYKERLENFIAELL